MSTSSNGNAGPGRAPVREPVRDAVRATANADPWDGTEDEFSFLEETNGSDRWYIPPEVVPDGWIWRWRRVKVWNWPDEKNYLYLKSRRWEPVKAKQWPGGCMPGTDPEAPIEREGLMLMAWPEKYHKRAEEIEKAKAMVPYHDLADKLNNTPAGTMERRVTHARRNIEAVHLAVPEK